MLQIFKKFFSLKIFSKKIFLVFLIFSLFILFCPFSFTNAQWGTIGKALAFLPNLAITIVLQITVGLVRIVFELSNYLLGWAIGNPFKVSFTDPANPVIGVGWVLLRDIVNMLFILGLAYIGLATSLNFGGFQTKKMFGNLLLIALIINFTPVICGVIVDISNILSNFFLRNADFTAIVTPFGMFEGGIRDMLGDIFNFVILLKTLILIIYGLLGSFVFLLFALLFFVRGPIIWILVILSPLAFFSWIFPKTKGKIWNMWWNQFLQWSFVVVPASFFLYLSQQVIVKKDELLSISGTDPAGGLFVALAPYFVALMFMIFGFVITLQINAMGTKGFMAGVKRGSKAAAWTGAKIAGKATWTGAKATGGAVAAAVAGAHMRRTYQAGRALGLSPYKAAGEAVKRQWQRRTKPAIIKAVTSKAGAKAAVKAVGKAVIRAPWAATKGLAKAEWAATKGASRAATIGTWSAVKEMTQAGWKAGWKIKAKKKGEKCPQCKTALPLDADYCPNCGLKF